MIVRWRAKTRRVAAGQLAGVQRDRRHFALVDDHLDPAADQPGIQLVVVGVDAQIGIGRRPGPSSAGPCRASPPAAAPAARRRAGRPAGPSELLCVRALALTNQASSWSWKSSSFANRAAGLEVGLRVALQPLDRALGLRIGGRAEAPADPQLAAERGERLARATLRGRGCRPGGPRAAPAAARPVAPSSRRSRPAGPRPGSRRPTPRRRRASSPGTRPRHSRGASGHGRPGSPRAAARRRTGRPPRAARPPARTSSAPARTAAGPRASSHRRPSCPPGSPAAQAARGPGPPSASDPPAAAGGSPP